MFPTVRYLIALAIFTPYYGLSVIFASLLNIENRPGGVYDRAARNWSRKLLAAARVPVRTEGMERIPQGQPVVFVSNHQSWFDILALAATIPGTVRFMSKKELAKVPLLGRAMRSAGHIFLDRANRQAAFGAYEETAKVIRAGLSAVVFGEGTRSRTGRLQPFKKGPFVFAIAAQVPIVPVYCAHTFAIQPKGSIRIRPRPVTLHFGEPIPTAGLSYDDRNSLLDRTHAVIARFEVDAGPDRN